MFFREHKKSLFVLGTLLVVVAFSVSTYFHYRSYHANRSLLGQLSVVRENNRLMILENEDLKSDKIGLEETQEALIIEGALQKAKAEILSDLTMFMTSKFDELDEVLLETDSNSLRTIEWFVDNGYFEDQAYAGIVFGNWLSTQKSTTKDYNKIKDDMTMKIDELERMFDNINTSKMETDNIKAL